MSQTHRRSPLVAAALAALAVTLSLPAGAETYAKTFELNTLDYQYAASLVVELCKSLHQRPSDCKVQVMNAGAISVWGTPAVHSEVIRLLADKDVPVRALGFRVILVLPGPEARPDTDVSPEIRKALAAVREVLGVSSTAIEDTGLIWTTESGRTRLAADDGTAYDVRLEVRSVITRASAREVTVELELTESPAAPDKPPVLSSVVTLKLGETIVAGASRARPGNKPLIVLLTALPAGKE